MLKLETEEFTKEQIEYFKRLKDYKLTRNPIHAAAIVDLICDGYIDGVIFYNGQKAWIETNGFDRFGDVRKAYNLTCDVCFKPIKVNEMYYHRQTIHTHINCMNLNHQDYIGENPIAKKIYENWVNRNEI